MKTELIKRAIESAQNRNYKLSKDLEHNISDLHRKKANGQKEVMQVTIEALEKQIPKKVKREQYFYGTIDYCPVCNWLFRDRLNYCPNCGQALDWSEENE